VTVHITAGSASVAHGGLSERVAESAPVTLADSKRVLYMVGRRVIVGGASALCLSTLIACGGHSKSWQYGYQNADWAIKFQEHNVSVKFACSAAASAFMSDEPHLDRGEFIAGCTQGVNDATK